MPMLACSYFGLGLPVVLRDLIFAIRIDWFLFLAPVVQTSDSAIHRINHYPADKYYGNQLRYPLDSDLSGGWRYPTFEQPGPGN